ncbi:TrkH family potassium uptake protein [Breznakiellaceae bacterium SP9]
MSNAKSTIISFTRIICALVGIAALSMLVPVLFALANKEFFVLNAFLAPMSILVPASVFLLATKNTPFTLSPQSGFSVVAVCWILTGVLGALPLKLSGTAGMVDALFESVSGFTTTGATVLTDVSSLAVSINVWRCLMHWLGGMGIVVLTAAILPLIGGNGFWLIKAETSGPEKGRITPKIAQTEKILWLFYLGFTLVQMLLLICAGMNFPDALCHAFSTMGTGGFSTKTEGVSFYDSRAVEIICSSFMFLAGINFSLYFDVFNRKSFDELFKNSELRAYCVIVAASVITITFILCAAKTQGAVSLGRAANSAVFHVLSVITTAGFAIDDFTAWAPAAQMVLFFLMFTGGCAGSTAGGIKIIRWIILAKQTAREYQRTLHPHGIRALTINGKPVKGQFVFSAAAFIALYLALVLAAAITCALIDGTDAITSLSASLAVTGNIGVALGAAGPAGGFTIFSAPVKLVFCFAMLVGRLELYAVLLLFFPRVKKTVL